MIVYSMKRKKNEDLEYIKKISKIALYIIRIPFRIIKFIVSRLYKGSLHINSKNKNKYIEPVFEEFKVLKGEKGSYDDWINDIYSSDSKIGIIIGARGSGKTGIGIKLLENLYAKYKKKCFAMGFNEKEFPNWIKVVPEISKINNDSFVLIDEGGIFFSSRDSMTNINKLLSELILISRHKNISILFISQNSSNLDVNILRQADFLILKNSSLLQKEFERKIIQRIYDSISENFSKYKKDKRVAYIYSNDFQGFISNPLPSFWGVNISKSFR
jgi:hypothetical protein